MKLKMKQQLQHELLIVKDWFAYQWILNVLRIQRKFNNPTGAIV